MLDRVRNEMRERAIQNAASLGITIEKLSGAGYRLHGRNGRIDFKVLDLADVIKDDLMLRTPFRP